ncbi:MAG: SCP2 sterol-binding domain-containing protein [Moraxella sp.]|nr:SCP2 sterol-binding domain-containing protein [Moraxella sp.]
MAKFLSDAWFDEIALLNERAGDLHLPPTLAELVVNAEVTGEDGVGLHLKHGKVGRGLVSDAKSKILVDKQTLAELIASKDTTLALEAFMMGKIRIEGDMSQMLALQSVKPTTEQKALFKQMLAITEF